MSKPHKWSELIKAWADGAEIQGRLKGKTWEDLPEPYWNGSDAYEYRIKPESETYWLCCGSKHPIHHREGCNEAKRGFPHHCKYGTAEEHSQPEPAIEPKLTTLKGSMHLYRNSAEGKIWIDEVSDHPLPLNWEYVGRIVVFK